MKVEIELDTEILKKNLEYYLKMKYDNINEVTFDYVFLTNNSNKDEIKKDCQTYIKEYSNLTMDERTIEYIPLNSIDTLEQMSIDIDNLFNQYSDIKDILWNSLEKYCDEEITTDSLIGLDTLNKIDFFRGTYHHVMIPGRIDYNIYKNTHDILVDQSTLKNALTPAVCLHNYSRYENKILANRAYTTRMIGKVFRDEANNLDGKFRLNEFQMLEFVCIGDDSNCQYQKNLILDLLMLIFQKLELNVKLTTATDIFFDDTSEIKMISQLVQSSKVEIRVDNNGNDLAIGSINMHGTHFTKPLNIRLESGYHAQSCCIGIGIERLRTILQENL